MLVGSMARGDGGRRTLFEELLTSSDRDCDLKVADGGEEVKVDV